MHICLLGSFCVLGTVLMLQGKFIHSLPASILGLPYETGISSARQITEQS